MALDAADLNVATEVRVQADRLAGTVSARDSARGILVLEDGRGLQLLDGATLLDFSRDEGVPIHVEQVRRGDAVNCFGLEACPGDATDFYAFVMIVDGGDDGGHPGSLTSRPSTSSGPSRDDDDDR